MLQRAGINAKAPPSDYGEDGGYECIGSQRSMSHGKNKSNKDEAQVINQTPSRALYCRYK